MKRFRLAIILVMTLTLSGLIIACDKSKKESDEISTELEDVKEELGTKSKKLAKSEKDKTDVQKYLDSLKQEVRNLKIENQELIAVQKRLEAEIIDLKIETGAIPGNGNGDATKKKSKRAKKEAKGDKESAKN